MAALAEIAAGQGLVLAHENEKEIFGDTPGRCADLITSVNSPALRATFDAANFVQCGVRPFSEAYGLLRPTPAPRPEWAGLLCGVGSRG